MPRAARLIIYDFEEQDALDLQLARSMNEGTRPLGVGDITVINVPAFFLTVLGKWAHEEERKQHTIDVTAVEQQEAIG